jgi:hypothetical protein
MQGLNLRLIILIIVISIIVSFFSIFIYDRFFALKVTVVDLRSFIEQTRVLYSAGKLSEQDVDRLFNNLKKQIDSLPDNCMVISSEVVLKKPKRANDLNLGIK